MKVFGQEVGTELLYIVDDVDDVDDGFNEDIETYYNWDSMLSLQHLDEIVALQVIDYRFINETQSSDMLTDKGKKRIRRLTERAMGEGYNLADILNDLITVLYRIEDDYTIEKLDQKILKLQQRGRFMDGHRANELMKKKKNVYKIAEAVVRHKSPANLSYRIREVDYREHIMCCVNWYYKKNQPMVKACRD